MFVEWIAKKQITVKKQLASHVHTHRSFVGVPKLFRGNEGSLTIIAESGLYKLLMRSDKPQAKPFQDWVTKLILPSYHSIPKQKSFVSEGFAGSRLSVDREDGAKPQLLLNPVPGVKTMSSLEIAELTGKQHKDVVRDIRVISDQLEGGGLSRFAHTYTHPQNKQTYSVIITDLPGSDC